MPLKFEWDANDRKQGMDLEELEFILDTIRESRPGVKFRLKATVGFRGQIQKLTFEEAGSVVPEA